MKTKEISFIVCFINEQDGLLHREVIDQLEVFFNLF